METNSRIITMTLSKVFKSLKEQDKQFIKILKRKRAKEKKSLLKLGLNKKPRLECDSMLRRMKYPEFLESRYWKFVRSLVLKRDKDSCRVCKSQINLQVHHETYKHHFNELNHLGDLITLCGKCHKEHHYAQL